MKYLVLMTMAASSLAGASGFFEERYRRPIHGGYPGVVQERPKSLEKKPLHEDFKLPILVKKRSRSEEIVDLEKESSEEDLSLKKNDLKTQESETVSNAKENNFKTEEVNPVLIYKNKSDGEELVDPTKEESPQVVNPEQGFFSKIFSFFK